MYRNFGHVPYRILGVFRHVLHKECQNKVNQKHGLKEVVELVN